ncbi:MAG: hypothetical protein ACOC1O_04960 [bacterium]
MYKKYIKISVFLLIILFINIVPIFAMDNYEEDCWIGARLYDTTLTENEEILPFIDIRENHFDKSKAVDHFKTILADVFIIQSLDLYKDIVDKQLNNKTVFLDYIKDAKNIKNNLALEVNILLSSSKEIKDHFNKLIDKTEGNISYRFFHIQINEFEEMTMDHLSYDFNGTHSVPISFDINEFPESKKSAEIINSMIPLYPDDIVNYIESPLVSLINTYYTKEDKNRIKREYDKFIFNKRRQVVLNEKKLSISDIETLYNDLIIFMDDNYISNVNSVIHIKNTDLSDLLNEYKEVR